MQINLSVEEFNYITPWELSIKVEAYNKNKSYEKQICVYNAWLTAKLSKAQKIPDLNELLEKNEDNNNTYSRSRFRMNEREIEIHFARFKKERRLLLIG